MRRALVALVPLVLIAATTATAVDASASPGLGSPGIGDPYFPHDGNGGYDVQRYGIDVSFNPRTHGLVGSVAIRATSLKSLARFDLDLVGLKVDSLHVDGAGARWSRTAHELRVRPRHALVKGHHFTVAGALPRQAPSAPRGRPGGQRGLPDRRRVPGRRAAARGRDLVPGQRPPARQGVVRHQHHRAQGPGGALERPPGRQAHQRCAHHLELEGVGADGVLPRHRDHRAVPAEDLQGGRHLLRRRHRPHALPHPGRRRVPPSGPSPRRRWTSSPRS